MKVRVKYINDKVLFHTAKHFPQITDNNAKD